MSSKKISEKIVSALFALAEVPEKQEYVELLPTILAMQKKNTVDDYLACVKKCKEKKKAGLQGMDLAICIGVCRTNNPKPKSIVITADRMLISQTLT